jgi:hypothetical protein
VPRKSLPRRKTYLSAKRASMAAIGAALLWPSVLSGAMAHPGHEHAGAVHAPADLMIGPIPLKVAVAGILVAALALYALKKQRDRG